MLAVVLVFSKNLRGEVAASSGLCKVEQLLGKLWVRCTIAVVRWGEPVTTGNGGISFYFMLVLTFIVR